MRRLCTELPRHLLKLTSGELATLQTDEFSPSVPPPTLQDFATVVQQLGPSEDPAQLKAAADALSAMLPLDGSLQSLVDLRAALTVLQAAGTTDAYIPSTVADLQAVQGVAEDVAAISGTLRTLQVLGR